MRRHSTSRENPRIGRSKSALRSRQAHGYHTSGDGRIKDAEALFSNLKNDVEPLSSYAFARHESHSQHPQQPRNSTFAMDLRTREGNSPRHYTDETQIMGVMENRDTRWMDSTDLERRQLQQSRHTQSLGTMTFQQQQLQQQIILRQQHMAQMGKKNTHRDDISYFASQQYRSEQSATSEHNQNRQWGRALHATQASQTFHRHRNYHRHERQQQPQLDNPSQSTQEEEEEEEEVHAFYHHLYPPQLQQNPEDSSLNADNRRHVEGKLRHLSAGRALTKAESSSHADHRSGISRRRAFLDKDAHAGRTFYFRKYVNFDKIIEDSTRKLQSDPNNIKALSLRAGAYSRKGENEKAILDYTAVLQIVPSDTNALYNRGVLYDKQGMLDKAIEDYTRVLELDSDHVNAAYARASSQNRRGNFAAAIIDYQLALEKDQEKSNSMVHSPKRRLRRSNSFTSWSTSELSRLRLADSVDFVSTPNLAHRQRAHDFGDTQLRLGQADANPQHEVLSSTGVIQSSERAQRYATAPKSSEVAQKQDHQGFARTGYESSPHHHNHIHQERLSQPQMRQDDLQTAQDKQISSANDNNSHSSRSTHKVKDQKLRDADFYHTRGFQHRKNGDFRSAIADYTTAIALNPRHFKAYFNRGFSHDKLGNFRAAIADYLRALEIEPSNAYTFYNLGISYDRCGEFAQAVESFTRAIAIDSHNADFFHNRGFSYRKLGDYGNAIKDYTRALEIDPRHFKAYYNRAFSYDKISDFKRAILDYSAALKINPNNSNSYHNRGSAYEKLGRLDEAIRDFTAAIALDVNNAASYNSRGLCYDKLCRYDEALADFTQAMAIDAKNPIFYHNRAITLRNM